ncbi:hypothetical protein QAD02_000524 [Eretmocerus hayati]|uniref:Uncharacterized protein n=1 Tax=Eretmocerus hayati TaxID=131215 RepID=A0ACC2NDL7_9HYME|nr:hypothetical protein QAD02_000524 [Eretmocerus hayati]
MITSLRELVHFFKRPKWEQFLKAAGGTRLQNFPDTRFCYIRDSCRSVLQNLNRLRNICQRENDVPQDINGIVMNEPFQQWLQNIVNELDPICVLMNSCQNPISTVAEDMQMWLTLQVGPARLVQLVEDRIARMDEQGTSGVAYLANLLNPLYQGAMLNDQQRLLAHRCVELKFSEAEREEFNRFIQNRDDHQRLAIAIGDAYVF